MSLQTTAIVEGKLIRVTERTVTRAKDGQVFNFRDALIIGEHCMASVRVADEMVGDLPEVGQELRARIVVDTFRDDVSASLDEVLSTPGKVARPQAA